MLESTEALLQPSLSREGPAPAIYSARATFFTAFFGGPLAALLIGGLNSHHTGRLRKDALLLIGLAVASLIGLAVLAQAMGTTERRTLRLGVRLMGLAVWGLFFLVHRPLFRAAELSDDGHRKPWVAGLTCVGVAAMVQTAWLLLVRYAGLAS